jgi:ubiquinone/menaquinone biosynthesis C-methylase UbiE
MFSGWQGSQLSSPGHPYNFADQEPWLGSEGQHRARYRFARGFVKGKDVLDAGCGNGYGSMTLLKGSAKSVTGVDISEESIAGAKSHYAAPNLSFRLGDLQKLPFSKSSFDVIIAFEIIEQVPEFEKVLQEFRRVLRPGGILIISTLNASAPVDAETAANPYLRRGFSPNEFVNLLKRFYQPPFELYGQFEKEKYNRKESFHIPTIVETLEGSNEIEETPRYSSRFSVYYPSRHTCPTEDDFIFACQPLEEALTLVALCHR